MDMILNRLRKNLKKRKPLLKGGKVEAYRLYEWDIPEYPYVIDVYGKQLVINSKEDEEIDAEKADHRFHLIDALCEIFSIDETQIFFKEHGVNQYQKITTQNIKSEVKEHQARFLINIQDDVDSGIALNHRPMRQRIFAESKDKTFLNLFSYTGTMSVLSALGGAKDILSVDMSKMYLEWAEENFELNDISSSKYRFFREDVLKFIKNGTEKFDLIFLGPPTFSNTKRMEESFEVERDQVELINDTMKMLETGGTLYFSNSKRKFKIAQSLKEKYEIKDISSSTIPIDFRDTEIHKCFKITRRK
ncbi:MAG: class I SAM-dependent methyltransferase [Bacteriovoracaceae bacterium]|nr:class I SAM-dependent methyltransferase [Bacteriovoracaceae bacterium]